MKPQIAFLALLMTSAACGDLGPTNPSGRATTCENPAPLDSPQTCATPNAPVDDFIVKLVDGIDSKSEGLRLGRKYGFEPEFWTVAPNFFGARLSREAFRAMQCEPTVAAFTCSKTNIPPP